MSFFKVTGLTKYFGGLAAVNNVSFEVQQGEVFGLIGPNGSGKTTIFNLISGFHKLSSGSIYFKGKRIDKLNTHKICRLGIGRTFQVVRPLKRMTVLENVITSAFCRVHNMREAVDMATEKIEFCGLTSHRDFPAGSLTIGDSKRLEIARALATEPELLLLDETFAGLNPKELDDGIQLIEKIKGKGITIIIVEHIMKVIMSISDRIHAINFGQTIAEGRPDEVAQNKEVIQAYLGESYAQGG